MDTRQAELNRVRIHHFHSHNRIRLTIYTQPFKNPQNPDETLFAVGMALCHKTDNGNRRDGLFLARQSAILAQFATDPTQEGRVAYVDYPTYAFIEPGLSIWRSPEKLKALIVNLRELERYCSKRYYSNSKTFSIYTKVFRGNFLAP